MLRCGIVCDSRIVCLRDYPEFNWDWAELSRNKYISFDFVLDHPEIEWDWIGLSQNRMSGAKSK